MLFNKILRPINPRTEHYVQPDRKDLVTIPIGDASFESEFYVDIEMKVGEIFSQIKKFSQIEYETRYPLYESIKVRYAISRIFFKTRRLSARRWQTIRKISNEFLKRRLGYGREKTKNIDHDHVATIVTVAIWLKTRFEHKFPNGDCDTVIKRFESWYENDRPHIQKIWVSLPVADSNKFQQEIDKVTPWFGLSSSADKRLKDTKINYRNMRKLVGHTFYGYVPSDRYFKKIGFNSPRSQNYSLADYVEIRNAIITSMRRRNRPVRYVLLEVPHII